MNERIMTEFKYAVKSYLSSLSISSLRTYARSKGVAQPTTMKKEDLIDLTLRILTGEIPPQERNNKGAPVKDKDVDPRIDEEVNRIHYNLLQKHQELQRKNVYPETDIRERLKKFREENRTVLRVEDPQGARALGDGKIYEGQLQLVDGVAMLLPLHGKDEGERIILPIDNIRLFGLRDGDVITCYTMRSRNALIVTEMLAINGVKKENLRRGKFEELDVCYPSERIHTYNGAQSVTAKYLEWLLPLGRGQRSCVFSAPKAGKTTFLFDVLKAINELPQSVETYALLVGQSWENVMQFRKVLSEENLVYTTYDDPSEKQVFCADFLLTRLKRQVECGKDVVLFVDSLTNLAKAFNETEDSVGGKTLGFGLESKTVHYIKRFFGSARCFEKGGSLTILAAISVDTGNPIDDLISAELLEISTLQIYLDEKLAMQRIFPSICLLRSKMQRDLLSDKENKLDIFLRNNFIPQYGAEKLRGILSKANSFEDFQNLIK